MSRPNHFVTKRPLTPGHVARLRTLLARSSSRDHLARRLVTSGENILNAIAGGGFMPPTAERFERAIDREAAGEGRAEA